MGLVRVRRLDGEELEVAEEALPVYTDRGWFVAEGGGQQTVAEVLGQVGDDPEKARLALGVEKASDKPRKSLVTALEERAGADQNKEK